MTLGTDEGAHLLLRRVLHAPSATGIGIHKEGTGDTQGHALRLMAVGTTDRVDSLAAQFNPFLFIQSLSLCTGCQARDIRTLTGPAGCRLRIVSLMHRGACTQTAAHIFNSIHVASWSFIIFCKGISGPQDYHPGTGCQDIRTLVAIIEAAECRVNCIFPTPVLVRITQGHRVAGDKNFIARFLLIADIVNESDSVPAGSRTINSGGHSDSDYTDNCKCL